MIQVTMDKGAHFHKTDFQVHTPRDTNWEGDPAATDAERKAYASELIQACRAKSLDAIAITDHHDLTFFPYVKSASANEVNETGDSIAPEHRVVVFPGVELTLSSPPCQAILLLDADFDETKLSDVLTALAIDIVDSSQSKLGNVDPISPGTITDLNDLEAKLNQYIWLKGKFIILPNITDQGHKDLLREGFQKHYKEMHCVGGYIDGSYERIRDGRKNILEGRQQNNGYKPIAVFQTSDNRKRDHSDLGSHITYVKWSEPTAEALRQACLAKESRLSLSEPETPNIWIKSLTVSNSKFLSRVDLEFNKQYNAVIGGRGTGKSTILEYIRWALCDQPIDGDSLAAVQNKRKNLIESTLQKFDGEVHVTFFINELKHIVKRSSQKNEILLKIGEADFVQATEGQIRNLLPIQAYSQKQLSEVGVRIEELKRFVEVPIKKDLDQVRSEIHDNEGMIRASYADLIRKTEIEAEIEKNGVEIESLKKQLDVLRGSLKGLSKIDQETIDQKAKYDSEANIIEELQNRLASAEERVSQLKNTPINIHQEQVDDESTQNKDTIQSIKQAFENKFAEIEASVQSLSNLFSLSAKQVINDEVKKWLALKASFDVRYEAAKANASVNQQQLNQIQAVEKRIATLNKIQIEKRSALTSLKDTVATYTTLRQKWDDLHIEKIELLRTQCERFTTLSSGLIKAEIATSLDTTSLGAKLKQSFTGMNIKEEKIERMCQHVSTAANPIGEWGLLLGELEKLSLYAVDSSGEMPETPILTNNCGLIDSERKRIATQMDSAKWITLSVTELEFNPGFLYCTNKEKDEYIEFADASAGQQATALLIVLLNQQGAPLAIDQPEDDIDSKMIKDIVHRVWSAKKKRQLIFASHSANFVVNGDADLVICCDYIKAGDQTGGRIKAIGAIDMECTP